MNGYRRARLSSTRGTCLDVTTALLHAQDQYIVAINAVFNDVVSNPEPAHDRSQIVVASAAVARLAREHREVRGDMADCARPATSMPLL